LRNEELKKENSVADQTIEELRQELKRSEDRNREVKLKYKKIKREYTTLIRIHQRSTQAASEIFAKVQRALIRAKESGGGAVALSPFSGSELNTLSNN
jgi:sugar-specific transcriptional regulator TrmB